MQNLPIIILKPKEEDRILKGHPWVYDNEIAEISEEYENGGMFVFKTSENLCLGVGYMNEKSVITGRLLDVLKTPAEVYDKYSSVEALLEDKISKAILKRDKIKNTDAIRYIYSEADSLAGLVVDMYGKTAVIQITTLGMDKLKDIIVKIIDEKLKPKHIYEKSISSSRIKEGLEKVEKSIKGSIKPVIITENDIQYYVDPAGGSKTGFYLDQRDNREKLKNYVKDKNVLDLFCYTGGFAASALHFGAASVKGVDSSAEAIEMAEKNMELNNLKDYCLVKADVFDELKNLNAAAEKYNVIIIDPPPFSRGKTEKKGGLKGYFDLHLKAMRLLNKDGVIFTFSCSQNISMAELIQSAKDAARKLHHKVELKAQLFQAKDHPYSTQIPETFYLKGAILKIV
ncbi:MAG: class I SAM-dependent rRNA methyltransferase [bacterium]